MSETAQKKQRGRPKKAKPGFLEGMGPPVIIELESLAESYLETRDERQRLTKDEVELHGRLLDMMHKHNLTSYQWGDYTIFIEKDEKEKVRVNTTKVDNDQV